MTATKMQRALRAVQGMKRCCARGAVVVKVSVQRLEIAGERFEVIELLLQIRSEEESSNLDPGVGEQAGVERPGVEVRIVVT